MEAIIPYLTFEGNARQALDFYCGALNGEVLYLQTFGETQVGAQVAPDWKDKVMHAAFQADNLQIMVSDTMSDAHKVKAGDQVNLSLNFNTEQEIDHVFGALAEGAEVTMPLETTFWGAKFGMLTDKFGIRWMFNHDLKQENKEG